MAKKRKVTFEIAERKPGRQKGKWSVTVVSSNGKMMLTSGEGNVNRDDLENTVLEFVEDIQNDRWEMVRKPSKPTKKNSKTKAAI